MKKECMSNAQLVSLLAKRFGKGQWSFIGLGSEKKWYSIRENSPQGDWDNMAEKMMLDFEESGHPNFPFFKSIVQRSTQKQRSWKIVDTLFSRSGKDWDYFSPICFCKSAQSLRSSRIIVWRVRNPSRSNGATRYGRAIEFLIRAERDQDRSSFGLWWPCSRRSSIAKVWRTNWKAITTRQLEQILYGCRISECCCNRTVLHDEKHCRFLTISCNGLSWRHSAKRRRRITTKRMDPMEYQNSARIGNCNLLLAR